MDFQLEHAYDADPNDVLAMLTNSEFLRARLAATGALDYQVVECARTTDGGYRIVTERTVQADSPGFAKKVFKPTNSMRQVEDWQADPDAAPTAAWTIEAKGVPVRTSGTIRLQRVPNGTVQHIAGTIKVSVPLIGGRLERFVFDQARQTIETEHRFGEEWLAKQE